MMSVYNPQVKLTQKAVLMSKISTQLTEKQFKKYIDPYLSQAKRGLTSQIPRYKLCNYILYGLHPGCQGEQIPIVVKAGSEKKKPVTGRSTCTFLNGATMAV